VAARERLRAPAGPVAARFAATSIREATR
jgi:hypothetical protein